MFCNVAFVSLEIDAQRRAPGAGAGQRGTRWREPSVKMMRTPWPLLTPPSSRVGVAEIVAELHL